MKSGAQNPQPALLNRRQPARSKSFSSTLPTSKRLPWQSPREALCVVRPVSRLCPLPSVHEKGAGGHRRLHSKLFSAPLLRLAEQGKQPIRRALPARGRRAWQCARSIPGARCRLPPNRPPGHRPTAFPDGKTRALPAGTRLPRSRRSR